MNFIDINNLNSSDIYRLMGMNGILVDLKKIDYRNLRKNYRYGAGRMPLHLYKYRPVSDEKSKGFLKNFIVNGEIWLSDKKGLNDPAELDFNWVHNNDKKEINLWWKENKEDFLKNYPNLSPAQRLLLGQKIKNAKISPQAVDKMKEDIWSQMGVYCLSTDPRSPHMWAHYASASEGVCVQLASYLDPLLGLAKQVQYTNQIPVLKLPSRDYMESYLYKGSTWYLEQEWRVVVPVAKKIVQINGDAIASVILGKMAARETVDFISYCNEERFKNGFKKFKVLKADFKSGSYDLKIFSV